MNSVKRNTGKKSLWILSFFYFLIAFEFFYMVSPFAVYFYSVYGPGLTFLNEHPLLSWLGSMFLPHVVNHTDSAFLNLLHPLGEILTLSGLAFFCITAAQVYYAKLFRKGAVTGGIYRIIRHPQYLALATAGFGILLLWPRYIALLAWIAMLFVYYFLALTEEKECEKKFGDAYRDYQRKTGMFFPGSGIRLFRFSSPLQKGICLFCLYLFINGLGIGTANFRKNGR